MAESNKAAEILATYDKLQEGAAGVSRDLLFSTAVNLACPWHWLGTATGVEALRAAQEEPMRPPCEFANNAADPNTAARQAAEEIEAAEGKGAGA